MARRSLPETNPEPKQKPEPRQKQKPEPKQKAKPRGSGLVLAGVPRVNLLPASEVRRRAAGVLIRRWVAGLLATAAVVSGLVAAAYWGRGLAGLQLAAEQSRTMALNSDLASLSHVSQAFAERARLTELRGRAMSTDTEWKETFAELTHALPSGARLTGFELIAGTNPVAETEPASGIGLVGRLTVQTDDPADQKRMIESLRTLDTTLAADAGALTADEHGFTFMVELVLDQTHYSGDHLPQEGDR